MRDIGFGKRVAIHWCGEDGVWQETPAEYRCALGDGDEVWVAELAVPLTKESVHPRQHPLRGLSGARRGAALGQPLRHQLPVGRGFRRDRVRAGGYAGGGMQSRPVAGPGFAAAGGGGPAGNGAGVGHDSLDGGRVGHASIRRRPISGATTGTGAWAATRAIPTATGGGCGRRASPCATPTASSLPSNAAPAAGRSGTTTSAATTASQRGTLRAMALNLHTYQEDDQQEKFEQVARAIREQKIDIVCLQEVGEQWNNGAGELGLQRRAHHQQPFAEAVPPAHGLVASRLRPLP